MSFVDEVEHQIRATIVVDPKSHLRANLPDRAATIVPKIWDFAWNLFGTTPFVQERISQPRR
jgi:hypothetical protein